MSVMAGLCKLVGACKLFELDVSGFKSLKKVKVTFPDSLTIVVGSNGSGKTALTEVFELLKELLRWKRRQSPDPFLKLGGYRNVVWAGQKNLPIKIGLRLDVRNVLDVFSKISEEEKSVSLEYIRDVARKMSSIDYEVKIMGDTTTVISDKLCLNKFGIDIVVNNGKAKFKIIDYQLFEKAIRKIKEETEKELLSMLQKPNVPAVIFDLYFKELVSFDYKKLLSELEKFQKMNLDIRVNYLSNFLEEGLKDVIRVIKSEDFSFELGCDSIIDIGIDAVDDAKKDIDNFIESFWENIRKNLMYNIVNLMSKRKSRQKKFPIIRIFCLLDFLKEFSDEMALMISCSATLIANYLERIIILKPLNYQKIKQLNIKSYAKELDSDCSNLINFLHTTTNGSIPEHVLEVLKEIWNVKNLMIKFEDLPYGYISLNFEIEEKITIIQASIPDGIWKALAIEAAILSNPTMIIIDEFENSLHARAQDLLLEELRNSNALSIVTTHSTIPLDFAKSLNEILVLELVNGETKSWRMGEIKTVEKKLEELGLTTSEGLLYHFIKMK